MGHRRTVTDLCLAQQTSFTGSNLVAPPLTRVQDRPDGAGLGLVLEPLGAQSDAHSRWDPFHGAPEAASYISYEVLENVSPKELVTTSFEGSASP